MGPFKQIKDGGLDTRKVAFECMYTLLDNSLDRLDIFEFLQHVEDGLKDHYDIKVSWMGDACHKTERIKGNVEEDLADKRPKLLHDKWICHYYFYVPYHMYMSLCCVESMYSTYV